MAKKTKKKKRSSNRTNSTDRAKNGHFAKGNKLSVGNKGNTNDKAKALKSILLETVTDADMEAIAKKLVEMAKGGEISAIKELFDRCLGRPLQTHEVDIEVKTYTPEQCDSIREFLAGRCVNADS